MKLSKKAEKRIAEILITGGVILATYLGFAIMVCIPYWVANLFA